MLSVSPVNLELAEQLRDDPEFRAEFFRLAAQESIASQIRFLRELRQLRQEDLAGATGMKQSAISRIEKADYASWNYSTLVRVAEALDARLKVTFEPYEDVIRALEGASQRSTDLNKKALGGRVDQSQDRPNPRLHSADRVDQPGGIEHPTGNDYGTGGVDLGKRAA